MYQSGGNFGVFRDHPADRRACLILRRSGRKDDLKIRIVLIEYGLQIGLKPRIHTFAGEYDAHFGGVAGQRPAQPNIHITPNTQRQQDWQHAEHNTVNEQTFCSGVHFRHFGHVCPEPVAAAVSPLTLWPGTARFAVLSPVGSVRPGARFNPESVIHRPLNRP